MGQDIANRTRGLAIVDAMNVMGYDALALGPLDLQLSETELRTAIAQAKFKILSANTVVANTGELFTAPYAVIEIGGHRVGVLGLTNASSRNPTLAVEDPVATARDYVPRVAQEADLVVLLSNAGTDVNQQIAVQVPGIDVIVNAGGSTSLDRPQVVTGTKTLLVQALYEGRALGFLGLQLDIKGKIANYDGQAWLLNQTFADDPDMVALINRYRAQFPAAPTATPTQVVAPPAPATRPASPAQTPTPQPAAYPSPSPRS